MIICINSNFNISAHFGLAIGTKFIFAANKSTSCCIFNNLVLVIVRTRNVLGAALTRYMNELMAHANEENWDEDFSVFYSFLSDDDAKVITNPVTVEMKKTESGWAISDNNDALKDAISGSLTSSGFLG